MSDQPDNPNQDLLPGAVRIGNFVLNPLTLKVAIALEKIDSPFVRPAVIDPETTKPVVAKASLEEVAQALYIFLNSHDPMLVDQLEDRAGFNRCVMNLAEQLSFAQIQEVTQAINTMMNKVNVAAGDAGLRPDVKKEPTGP